MAETYRFGPFELERATRRLVQAGVPVPLTAKAFDTLLVLVEEAGRMVDKDDLIRAVWPDTVVEDANLTQQIFLLRKALGERPRDHRYIVTVPRRGYRFVAPVTSEPTAPAPAGAVADAPRGAAGRALHLTLKLEHDAPMALSAARPFAIAPDGAALIYVGHEPAGTALFVRPLNGGVTRRVAGSEGALAPFVSPDGRWVAFFARGVLWKAYGTEGTPIPICETEADPRGGSWGHGNVIVFAASPAAPLSLVDANGGRPTPLTTLDFAAGERTHRWPHMLPGGRHALFTVARAGSASFDEADLWCVSLEDGRRRLVQRLGSSPQVVRTGHLLYIRGGSIMAVPFDTATATVIGSPIPVANGVMTLPTGAAQMAIADHGMFVYLQGSSHDVGRRLSWVNGQGQLGALPLPCLGFEEPRLSPDASLVAVGIRQATNDIWVGRCADGTLERLTIAGDNFAPVWTADGRAITFSSNVGGPCNLYQVPLGGGEPVPLVTSEFDLVPGSWTNDGETLLFTLYHPDRGAGIWKLAGAVGSTPEPLVNAPRNQCAPMVAPGGRSFAYASDESGRYEIYLKSFPEPGPPRRVSRHGGMEPVWSRDGRQLFFRSGSAVMAVDIEPAGLEPTAAPRVVADGPFQAGSATGLANFDVAPDGRLLVVAQSAAPAQPRELAVVVNWFDDLSRRVAGG